MAHQVRVRIAPSPTGYLHVGTARTALYNFLFAKHYQGKFILRLEDTDTVRSQDIYTQDVIDGLRWLGVAWDEGPDIGGPYGPYRQTDKIDHYERVAQKLVSEGMAYFCYCTSEELDQLKDEQKIATLTPRYDNRCRNLSASKINEFEAGGRVPAIRFKVDEPRIVVWHDRVKGDIAIDSSDLGGDMIIVKSNGVAVYNFAVVVDDLDMKITHVIRGEDHIHNTAKQLLLYEAFREKPPEFAHTALIFDTERRKLSKRHHGEAVHISKYKADGYLPEAMVNYLVQMSWTPTSEQEIFTLEEAVRMFDLSRVSKSPAVFDLQRLNWFNGQYLRNLPLAEVVSRALPYLELYDLSSYNQKQLQEIIGCVRDSLTTLSGVREAVRFFFEEPAGGTVALKTASLDKLASFQVLKKVLEHLPEFPWGNQQGCKAVVETIGKELNLKGKELYWPIRAALCGKVQGPDLGSVLAILGPEKVKTRIESMLQLCPQV